VQGWLEDPILTIYQGNNPILTNDNWGDAPDPATLVTVSKNVGAFSLLEGSTDAAALVVLMPGGYTAVARGVDGTVGNVLVEVYLVP
jgi:hypothetical protein